MTFSLFAPCGIPSDFPAPIVTGSPEEPLWCSLERFQEGIRNENSTFELPMSVQNTQTHHSSSARDDCVKVAVGHSDHGHELVSSTAQVEREAHPTLQDLQSQELGLVSGLVVVVVHEQRVALQGGELDVDVVVVGIQGGELHVGELLEAVAVQFTVFAENP